MNAHQELWWEQSRCDHRVLRLLRRHGVEPCQQLHYLQMVTEKLGKAYFWRAGQPPKKSHASFVRFLQALDDRQGPDRLWISSVFGFGRAQDFAKWVRTISPLAHDLEKLAPALAGDNGANPEYPWPWSKPRHSPASHRFAVWVQLTETGRGRELLDLIDIAVDQFPRYA